MSRLNQHSIARAIPLNTSPEALYASLNPLKRRGYPPNIYPRPLYVPAYPLYIYPQPLYARAYPLNQSPQPLYQPAYLPPIHPKPPTSKKHV